MTLSVSSLGSGSRGNCYLVQSGASRILLDAGLSARQTEQRLAELGVSIKEISALIITHEHGDHIAGLEVLQRKHGIPVWANVRTMTALQERLAKSIPYQRFMTGVEFSVGDFTVHPFSVFHDAADPVGLLLESNGLRIGLVQDLGYVSELVLATVKNCRVLLLEANHDVDMLWAGSYPWHIKKRILSRLGHLSNLDAAHLLESVWHPELQSVALCHLSAENNHPDLARKCIEGTLVGLNAGKVRLTVAQPHRVSEIIELDGERTCTGGVR